MRRAAAAPSWEPNLGTRYLAFREFNTRKARRREAEQAEARAKRALAPYEQAARENAQFFEKHFLVPVTKGKMEDVLEGKLPGNKHVGEPAAGYWATRVRLRDLCEDYVFVRLPRLSDTWSPETSRVGAFYRLQSVEIGVRKAGYAGGGGYVSFDQPIVGDRYIFVSRTAERPWLFPANTSDVAGTARRVEEVRRGLAYANRLKMLAEGLNLTREVLIGVLPLVGSIRDIRKEGFNLKTTTMLVVDVGSTFLFVGGALKGAAKTTKFLSKRVETVSTAISAFNKVGKVLTVGGASLQIGIGLNDLRQAESVTEAALALASVLDAVFTVAGVKGAQTKKDEIQRDLQKARKKYDQANALPSCRLAGRSCFPAGTLVATEAGLRPIETISQGTSVASRDEQSGRWQYANVAEPLSRAYRGEVVTIEAGGEAVTATAGHPFWVIQGEDLADRPLADGKLGPVPNAAVPGRWVAARHLKPADVLASRHVGDVVVASVAVRAAELPVYNLTVTGTHTYTVGRAGLWVHNNSEENPCEEINPLEEAAEDADTRKTRPEHENHVADLPFGYKDKPFRRFVQKTYDEFKSVGYDDAEFFMQGSSASGVKHSGEVLDARRGIKPSDYDVAVVSPKMLARAEELGFDVHGPLTPQQLSALCLAGVQDILSKASKGGIPVNFKLYRSIDDVYAYDKTIPFSLFRD